MTVRKVPIIATLVVAAAIATMVWLGFWQLDRLEQKEALLAQYEAAQSQSGYSFILPHLPEAAYTRTMEYCSDPGEPISVAGRNVAGEAGFAHVVRCTIGGPWPDTPPELQSLDYVLMPADIVIGWSRSPQSPRWVGGVVSGTVVPLGELGFKIVADPPLAGLEANAVPDPSTIPNNHFAYAVQWFLFALTALVIYILALRRRAR